MLSEREGLEIMARAVEIGDGESGITSELVGKLSPKDIAAMADYIKEGERNRNIFLGGRDGSR